MHKKRIKGNTYFYTSYRDKNGKIKTKYLGNNEKTAKKEEEKFKGAPQEKTWTLYLVLFLVISGILFFNFDINLNTILTGALIFEISANPSASGTNISNATAYFNTSLFGYGNYSDPDLDESNGTSSYQWFVNGIVNETGTTGQLLLCHFNNNYTCEEGETANITQYHTEFNTSDEQINVTLTEKNSTLVYFNIPKTAIITEAFMNVTGSLTSPYDLLQYDSEVNATYKNPGTSSASKHYMAGVIEGIGIDSWFLLNNTPSEVIANILSIKYGDTFGTPSNGNFSYNIKVCPANIESLSHITHTNNPDGNCTSPYIDLIDTVNLSSNFTDTSDWKNFTFYDNTSITFSQDSNFLLKFEFVDGDLSTNRYWKMYLVDDENNPQAPTYVGYNYTSYTAQKGNQLIQFYSKSRYPTGVEIDVGNDGANDFADVNESFDTTNTTADFTSAINTYLSSCGDAYCDVPVNVSSNSSGIVGLEALRISYDHYDLDGKFSQGIPTNYTYTIKYNSDNNIHNHNGTLDIWVKPYWAGNDGNEHTFFTDSNNIIQLNKSSGDDLVFFVDDTSVSCDISTWTVREWYLITATWDEGDKIYLYTNGSNCGSANAPSSISGLGESIFIGSDAKNDSQANVTIDELRITGFPRSPDEINQYFSESRAFYQNEIFLNSTDTQIKRDDEIIFEFTPVDITGATGGAENSTPLIISNLVPLLPVLNQPENDSYVSLPYSFNWDNATDYDKEDTLYYVLQIGDESFTEPVTYYNGSVLETASPTSDLVTGVADGNYSWRVLSSDLIINSSFAEQRVVTIDSTYPNLTLTSSFYKFLDVNSSETEKEITFYFNVSDLNPLDNCTLNMNETALSTVNQTLTSINQTENNFTATLAFGGYNWSINCTDLANNFNTTGETILAFVAYNNFTGKGRTTNFSEIDDPSNVTNLTIEEPEYGVINFTGIDLDLSNGIDIDSYVSISFNEIKIDAAGVPVLDEPANLTLFNLTLLDVYVIKDGVNCTDCTEIDDTPATYTFSITGGGTYTTSGVPLPPTPPPIPTGGSGGGGGTRTLTKTRSFTFDTGQPNNQFVLQMKRNAPAFEKINIENTGDLIMVLNLDHNLGNHLSLSPKQFRLEPKDTKVINANFYAGEPGLYTGKIVITADTIQKIIPVVLEVRSERIVVDAKLDIPSEYTELKQGDPLKAQITLFNTAQVKVPVIVTYLIKDLEGNIIVEEVETFDILDEKSFVKTFNTANLKAGSYITGMNVRYKDTFATSSARFDVKGESVRKLQLEFKWYYVAITITLFILIILLKSRSTDFGKLIQKKRRRLKKYEE